MAVNNPCKDCIGDEGQGEDCCIDVYIILNPDEITFFEDKEGYMAYEDLGGVYYTEKGCAYLKDRLCSIHEKKPLYCKYYPIFITGKPFVDHECPSHTEKQFKLPKSVIKEIRELQKKFPIYKKEWTWSEVGELFTP